MKSRLVNVFFKNTEYYSSSDIFGNFAVLTKSKEKYCFTKKINKEEAINELKIIKDIFEKFNVDFFLMLGTCLGAVRGNDFIEHDYDIDIGCYKTDLEKIILITKELQKNHRFNVYKLSLQDESISLIRDTVAIDINLHKLDKSEWKSNLSDIFKVPSKFFNELDSLVFLGLTFNVPKDVESYLEHQYGKDWKTPIENYYCNYRKKIEVPLFKLFIHFMTKEKAEIISKNISEFVKIVRSRQKNYFQNRIKHKSD